METGSMDDIEKDDHDNHGACRPWMTWSMDTGSMDTGSMDTGSMDRVQKKGHPVKLNIQIYSVTRVKLEW